MPYFNNSNTDQAIVTGTPTGDYSWDDAAQDIDLIPAIHRYAKNVYGETFHDDSEALDWLKHDRRWKDANTYSALKELNTVAGGWGTAKASKEDLQDLATIRNRWERLPTGGERILQGDIAGGLGAIAENVGKGLLDPTIAIGGIAGKAVGSKLAKAGIGIAIDAAISGGIDAAYQAGNVGIKKENPQLNLQNEVHPWEAIKAGLLGAAISTPGHVINAGHSAKVIGQKEIDLAAEQANAASANFKEKDYTSLRSDKEREKGLGLPTPPKDLSELEPAVAADLEKQLKDKNSLAYTLSSKQNIPLPEVIKQEKAYYDKVSGAMVHVNASDETDQLLREMKGWEEGREYVTFESPTTGKRTVKAVHEAADKALEGKNFDDVAKDITDLPKGYAANAQELSLIDRVKATAWDIFMKEEDEDKMTRSFQLYWDLFNKQRAMTSEAGRTLNMTKYMRYTPMSPQGVFGKAAKKVSKTINDVTGNTSPYAINQDNIVAIRNAIKSFTDTTTGELDPVKADTFLMNLENSAAKPSDMLWEAWYNGLLSNPSTMTINGIGNVATMALHLAENSLGDAWTIGRGSGSITEGLAGVKHVWAGYINSFPDSLKAFYKTFTTEVSVDRANRHEGFIGQAIPSMVWDDEKEGLWKFRKAGVGEKWAIGGKQARFAGRVLMATDDMSKIQHYGGNIASAALSEAESEGLKPGTTAFNTRVAELKANPTQKMQEYANDMMHRLTYTNSDKIATSISQFIESVPGGRLLVPFVRTPWNIAKYAADMLSIPGLISTKRTADDFAAGGFRANRAKARIMMGYGILAAGIWANMAGFTNGGGPTDPEKKDAWLANNLPWAIKVGNTQVQWSRLDPVALPFAMGAIVPDIIRNSNDEQADAWYIAASKLFSDAVLDKTWFEGVNNAVSAIHDPQRYGGGLAMNVARTFVPSVVAGSVRAWDPRVTAPQTLMEVMQDRAGFERGSVPTKLDVFGREQSFESLGGTKDNTGIGGKLARFVVPFRVKSDTNDPVANEVVNLGVNLKMPPKKLKGVELNAQQYNAYAKARGQFIYNGINHVMQNSDWEKVPTGIKREIVENFIEMANKTAEVTLAGVYPEVFREYSDPKNSKLYKQFTLPTQKEIDAKTTKPFGNPKLQGKEVIDRSADNQDTDPDTFSETLGLTFKREKKPFRDKLEVENGDFPSVYSSKLVPMLDNLAKNSDNAGYRELAASILDKVPDLTVGVKESQNGFSDLGRTASLAATGEPFRMRLYHAKGDKKSDGFNEETALHEALHVALKQALFTDKELGQSEVYKEVSKLHGDIASYHGPFNRRDEPKELWYTEAMRNTNEFLSYAMTNKNFQNYLKNNTRLLYKDGTSGWDVFKDIVGGFLGIENKDVRETDLDRVLRASKSLIGKFPKIEKKTDVDTPTTKPKEPLTNNKLSGIIGTSGLEIVSSKSPGVSYDPITNTITRGPEVSDDTISKLVKGRSAAWKDQTIKVKLEDGSMVDVPAHKAATIMKSKLSKARKLLEEFSSEA